MFKRFKKAKFRRYRSVSNDIVFFAILLLAFLLTGLDLSVFGI